MSLSGKMLGGVVLLLYQKQIIFFIRLTFSESIFHRILFTAFIKFKHNIAQKSIFILTLIRVKKVPSPQR